MFFIRFVDDISSYIGDRYKVAKVVCYTVMDMLEKLSLERRNRFLLLLSQ